MMFNVGHKGERASCPLAVINPMARKVAVIVVITGKFLQVQRDLPETIRFDRCRSTAAPRFNGSKVDRPKVLGDVFF